jgi:exopolyphosphatase/pppGpp-phosphohydrolase
MRKSILDIGTNSLKFFIFEIEKNEKNLIFHQKFEKRLGKNFDHENNLIKDETLQEVLEGLKEIQSIAEKYKG